MDLLASTTYAEDCAYKTLRSFGLHVVRQYPIDTGRRIYFADLFIKELNLIMEIDGGYHTTRNQKRLDMNRSSGMWRKGYHVCRISNRDARNREKILAKINLFIQKAEKNKNR